ncbi:MAG: Eco57I restriction-modification methylase domain-containing protein [Rhodobacteraceae bacterium]|nr:Eco57I restriction-modification methylase domain-containing protein [Paracoccaceae bacterium]
METGSLSLQHHFFHWHIEFAEVMQDGGFDVVIGNPPWERITIQEKEFFAHRSPRIASAPNKAARDRLIGKLKKVQASAADQALFADFWEAKRTVEATSSFVRSCGRFPLTGKGDINTYSLFTEIFLQLVSPRGMAGLVVPTGIATDKTTSEFFRHIVTEKRIASLYDFENSAGIFPDVDRRIKFSLVTLNGKGRPCARPQFAFFLHRVEQLGEKERLLALSAEDIRIFNPNTRTVPVFRTRRDMQIARKMYRRAGIFWRRTQSGLPEANPWGISFKRMFDMSNDSNLFRTQRQLEEAGWNFHGNVFTRNGKRYLPLYEAKLFHQYDHRFATFEGVSSPKLKKGHARVMTEEEKGDPNTTVMPRYWIPEEEIKNRLDKSKIALTVDRTGQDRTGQDRTGQDRTGQDRTGQDKLLDRLAMLARCSLSEG